MHETWLIIAMLLVIFLILGDSQPFVTNVLTPTVLNERPHSTWASWNTVDNDDRIRVLWIDKTYVPFVNAGNEVCTHQLNKFLLQQPFKWEIYVAAPNMPKRSYDNVRCFDLHDNATFYDVLGHTNILCSHNTHWRRSMQTLSRKTGIPFIGWSHTEEYIKVNKDKWNHPLLTGRQFTAYNSNYMKSQIKYDNSAFVLFPPVNYRDYIVERKEAKYVTLSNVNANKGGDLLIKLAEACPDIQFQGVTGGYDKQIKKSLPNLQYLPHTDNIKEVYATTKILIMPSRVETWGRTAVEAMSSGIPVVATPTPGLRECCQDAAIYVDRNDVNGWIQTVRKLWDDSEHYNKRSTVALDRSRALDPLPGLESCRDWMEKTVVPAQITGHPPSWMEKNLLFL